MEFIRKSGRYWTNSSLEPSEFYAYEDLVVLQFLHESEVQKPTGFSVVRPCFTNYWPGFRKFDKAEVWRVSDDVSALAERFLTVHFASYLGKFRKIALQDVTMDMTTRSGFPWNMTKEETLRKNYPYFLDYVHPGMERPRPIYKVTGKTEYMPMDSLKDHKIRIFKNPPLEYLLLEKVYFTQMEVALLSYKRDTWSALGFVKESGGWNRFVTELKVEGGWFFKWDVKFFDKQQGSKLLDICKRLRLQMFAQDANVNLDDIEFLYNESSNSLEITYDGQVWITTVGAKSGRLCTSTDNTIVHIYLLFVLYIRWCHKNNLKPSYNDMMKNFKNFVYSDDIQGMSLERGIVSEDHVRETFQLFGMDIQEYCCTQDTNDIHFLGAANIQYEMFGQNWYVPKYDEARMLYALAFSSGKVSDELRANRVLGLMHNLCFSKYANVVEELQGYLRRQGRWPASIPFLSAAAARFQYADIEGLSHL